MNDDNRRIMQETGIRLVGEKVTLEAENKILRKELTNLCITFGIDPRYIDDKLSKVLADEDICEWVLQYHTETAFWDIAPNCCVGEFSMNKPTLEICPSCKKKIRYKEIS